MSSLIMKMCKECYCTNNLNEVRKLFLVNLKYNSYHILKCLNLHKFSCDTFCGYIDCSPNILVMHVKLLD